MQGVSRFGHPLESVFLAISVDAPPCRMVPFPLLSGVPPWRLVSADVGHFAEKDGHGMGKACHHTWPPSYFRPLGRSVRRRHRRCGHDRPPRPRAEVVNLKGDSYRLKDRNLGRLPTDDAA